MMNKLLIAALISISSFSFLKAQMQQEEIIYNADEIEITLDGNSKDWQKIPKTEIKKTFQNETPSLDSAYWKAIWNDNGIYVLVEVWDDIWHPSWATSVGWAGDRIELYFDLSDPQQDGLGAKDLQGNYQISPNFSESGQGIAKEFVSDQFPEGNGCFSADTYDEEGYYAIEYYIPLSAIPTNKNEIIDPWVTTVIGFDVTIIDVDNNDERNRAVWSNTGEWDESWNNCDQVGLIYTAVCKCDPLAIPEEKPSIFKTNIIMDNIHTNLQFKTLAIYNNIGAKVYEGRNNDTFDVSFLKSGVYIVKVLDGNNNLYTEKIIKN